MGLVESTATRPAEPTRKLAGASIGAAIAAAFASSLCCLGPLLLAALGLGGAGLLVELEAYRPYLAALTVGLLGAGVYLTYRRPRLAGPDATGGPACDCAVPAALPFAHATAEGVAVAGSATTTLRVEGMTCPSCKVAVRTALSKLEGVKDAKVDVAHKRASVEYDPSKVTPQQLVDAVNRLGYQASLPAKSGS